VTGNQFVSYLVLPLVNLDGGGVGQDEVVRGEVGLGAGVAAGAGAVRRRAALGRVGAEQVALARDDVGLVEGDPVLDAVAERREAHVGEVAEVAPDLGAEPRPVPVLQLLRDVVVVQRDERLYSCSSKPKKKASEFRTLSYALKKFRRDRYTPLSKSASMSLL